MLDHKLRDRHGPGPRSTRGAPGFWQMAHALGSLNESDRIDRIKTGFPVEMADAAREAFGLTSKNMGTLLSLSVATYERRRKGAQPLDPVASERLDRIAAIALLAEEVFEDAPSASEWLASPHPALGGNQPIMHCETAIGARQVRRILNALEWGGVA
jgi:putative toxin-antitoxin system antitoxin component (TIGR02293 family)